MNTQEKAEMVRKFFVKKTRDDGNSFYCLTDNAPLAVKDLVRNCHDGMLPDDYRFMFIMQVLDAIAEAYENDPLEPEIYNNKLLDWLGSRLDRPGYVDRAIDEWGKSDSIMTDIMNGYALELKEVLLSVVLELEKINEKELTNEKPKST